METSELITTITFAWTILGIIGWTAWRLQALNKSLFLTPKTWTQLFIYMIISGPVGFIISMYDIENYLY